MKIGGNSASRVFELSGAGATLSCLTVQGGTTQKTQDGGGVYMTGNGVVTNCVVTGVSGKTNYHGLNIYMTDGLVVDSEISSGATAQVCNGMNLYMSGGRAMRCEIKDAVGTTGNSFALYMDGGIAESCLVTGSKTRWGGGRVLGRSGRAAGELLDHQEHLLQRQLSKLPGHPRCECQCPRGELRHLRQRRDGGEGMEQR